VEPVQGLGLSLADQLRTPGRIDEGHHLIAAVIPA
jgi:hypothetical protein